MPENVQLQQVVVDGMVVKMGRDDIRRHIVGRVLDRREGVDLLPVGQHHDAAGMLAGGTPHAHAALDDPVDLAGALVLAPLLVIVFHIAEGRLVRQGTDGPGPEGLALSEDDLRVLVGLGLVVAGEIQVDIRLLVPLEAQEGLEGNVKAVLLKGPSADRAGLVRHIAAGRSRVFPHFLRLEITVVAGGTVIMGRQGVDLRDSRHGRHKGGADRTSRSHQIAVVVGLPHQLLGDDIHHGEAVGNDRMELLFQTVYHHLRKLLPVNGVGPLIADVPEGLIGILDDGRTLIRPHRGDPLDHVGNLVRVAHHHLPGLVASQILEFRQHLLGGPKVERRLLIRVLEALSGHDDTAVDLVLRIQEMDVAGGHYGLAKLLAQGDDPLIEPDQILLGLKGGPLSPQHKFIVAQGLDLQIVIEIDQPRDLLLRSGAHQSLVQLARLAG